MRSVVDRNPIVQCMPVQWSQIIVSLRKKGCMILCTLTAFQTSSLSYAKFMNCLWIFGIPVAVTLIVNFLAMNNTSVEKNTDICVFF